MILGTIPDSQVPAHLCSSPAPSFYVLFWWQFQFLQSLPSGTPGTPPDYSSYLIGANPGLSKNWIKGSVSKDLIT